LFSGVKILRTHVPHFSLITTVAVTGRTERNWQKLLIWWSD